MSKEEQRKRFLDRIEKPEKNWKFSLRDVDERAFWDDYQRAYEEVLAHTSTPTAPWHVIPADHKWFTRTAASAILVDKLREIDPQYPTVSDDLRRELLTAKQRLESEA